MFGRKMVAAKEAPQIPFRVNTEEEIEEFWNYAIELPPKARDEFWKSTIPKAQMRANFLKKT